MLQGIITRQDNEMSQFLNHLEVQKQHNFKKQAILDKLKQKADKLQDQQIQKQRELEYQRQLRSARQNLIYQEYERNQQLKQKELNDKLYNQEQRHSLILNSKRDQQLDVSQLRSMHLDDSLAKAQSYSAQLLKQKQDYFTLKMQLKNDYLDKQKQQKEISTLEQSMTLNQKEAYQIEVYQRQQEIVKQKQQYYNEKQNLKDILSKKLLDHQQKMVKEKLEIEKIKIEIGLERASQAQINHKAKLNDVRSKTEFKMKMLESKLQEREEIRSQRRNHLAQIEKSKLHLNQQFQQQMQLQYSH